MSCKHENADHLMAGERWALYDDPVSEFGQRVALVECLRCIDCGHWLPIGPANDDDPRVAAERAAAKRAAFNRETKYRPGYDRFDFCVDTNSGELCALCEALYLVNFINEDATHDQGQEAG